MYLSQAARKSSRHNLTNPTKSNTMRWDCPSCTSLYAISLSSPLSASGSCRNLVLRMLHVSTSIDVVVVVQQSLLFPVLLHLFVCRWHLQFGEGGCKTISLKTNSGIATSSTHHKNIDSVHNSGVDVATTQYFTEHRKCT